MAFSLAYNAAILDLYLILCLRVPFVLRLTVYHITKYATAYLTTYLPQCRVARHGRMQLVAACELRHGGRARINSELFHVTADSAHKLANNLYDPRLELVILC